MAADGTVRPDPFEEWTTVLQRHPCLAADIQEMRAVIAASLDAQMPRRFRWPAELPPTAADRFDTVARLAYEDADRRQAWLRSVSRRERFVLTTLGSLLNQGAAHLADRYPRLHTKSPGVSPTALQACFKVLLVTRDWDLAARHLALWANAARHSSAVVELHLRESLPLDALHEPDAIPHTRRITPLEPTLRGLLSRDAGPQDCGVWDAHIGSLRQGDNLVSPGAGVDGLITIRLRGGIDPAEVGRLAHQAAEQLRPYLGAPPESKRGAKREYGLRLRRYLQWVAWRDATLAVGGTAKAETFATQVANGLAGDWRAWPADVKEIAKATRELAWWLDPVPVDDTPLVAPRYRSALGAVLFAMVPRFRATLREMTSILRTGRRPMPDTLPATLPAPDGPGPLVARLLALLWVPALVGANLLRPPVGPWPLTLVYNLALLLFLGLQWNEYRPERGDDYPFLFSPWLENAHGQSSTGGEKAGDIPPVDHPARQA